MRLFAPALLIGALLACWPAAPARAAQGVGLVGEVRELYLLGQAQPEQAFTALGALRERAITGADPVLRLRVDEAECRLRLDIDQRDKIGRAHV